VDVRIARLLDGARQARGTVVIVDVFRCYTTAAVALAGGADGVILVAEPEEALALKAQGAGELCFGEVDGKMPPGFDLGNSPYDVSRTDVRGKRVILSTRAGTVGAVAAEHATRLYGAALVVARATAEVVRREAPPLVTVVAMGGAAKAVAEEDEICARYVRDLLEGRPVDPIGVGRQVRASPQSAKFDDPTLPHFHPIDRDMASVADTHDFAIAVEREGALLVARRRWP
jgi:2-phosphosulfolactate phosphatase